MCNLLVVNTDYNLSNICNLLVIYMDFNLSDICGNHIKLIKDLYIYLTDHMKFCIISRFLTNLYNAILYYNIMCNV